MGYMFGVRPSPRPGPQSAVAPSPLHAVHAPRGRPPPPAFPACSSPRTVCPPCDPRQGAWAFNQPLSSWDTSRVGYMNHMFNVRPSPALLSNLHFCSHAHTPLHAARATRSRPCTRGRAGGSCLAPYTPYALRATRQGANSLSDANKQLIRCAWAGTAAFDHYARFGSGTWPSTESCA